MIDKEDGKMLYEVFADFRLQLQDIKQGIEDLNTKLQSNTDTTADDREAYLNKIGRMLASGKYEPSATFLRRTFAWVEQAQLITRKQMAAIDRIEAHPFGEMLGPYGNNLYFDVDPER